MSTYLLLRDNKESGPYSFDELKNKGLKPYDLVWIEGKSAAWRYPSEVEELKSFAPAVEEQPFDRFYKKSVQSNSSQNNSSTPAPNNSSVATPSRPVPEKETSFSAGMNGSVISAEPSSVPGKRIIYVTLPSDRTGSGMRVPSYREPVRVQPPVPVQEKRTPPSEKEPVRAEMSSLYVKAAGPVEEKFAQDADDMWKSAVELTPRQQGPGLKAIMQPVLAIACVLALLAAGVFIGLSIKSNSFGFSQKTDAQENPVVQVPVPAQQDHVPAASTPAVSSPTTPVSASAIPATTNSDNTAKTTVDNPSAAPAAPVPAPGDQTVARAAIDQTALVPPAVATPKKKTARAKNSPVNPRLSSLASPIKDSAAMTLPVVHREATHRADETTGPGKDAVRSNIANMLSVGIGKFTVGTFGGISDLQMTVSNRSMYPIDLVVVEVQYVQANKKIFKTEDLYFRDLGPGAAMMLEAPKSSRGVKIQYKITLVNSKELGLSYSGL
jgi:hypothetical protein